MLYRDNKSCESTKIRPIRLTNWPESHFCIQTWHKRDILCTCNKLASSQQVFHPLFTKNRNATNQSWRISTWCIRHVLPVLLSSEVLRCNSQIVIPIFSCWYKCNYCKWRFLFICGIYYVHTARDVSAPNFFVLQLFANTACLFHLYQADGYCRCVIF